MAEPIAELRPMTTGELLDRTFFLYRDHFSLFAGIMVIPHLALIAMNLLIQALVRPDFVPGAKPSPEAMARFGSFVATSLLLTLLFWLMYAIAEGVTALGLSDIYLGRSTSIRSAYHRARSRIGTLLALPLVLLLVTIGLILATVLGLATLATILSGLSGAGQPVLLLMIGAAYLVAIGLTVVFLLRYGVAIPVVVLEGLRTRGAMRRSASLTLGHRGRVFLIALFVTVIRVVASLIFSGPFFAATIVLTRMGSRPPFWLQALGLVSGGVGGTLAGPIMMIALGLLYYDLVVRKEAFDLQRLIAGLEPAAPDSLAPPPAEA